MKAIVAMLSNSHPNLNGVLHIRNLFNIRDSNSESALELYRKYCTGKINLNEELLHTDFDTQLKSANSKKWLLCPHKPWIWLGWTVEDKGFLNKRKRAVWNTCQNIPELNKIFAIYSRSTKHRKLNPNFHTYHPCPQNPNDKAKYKNEMIRCMKDYWQNNPIS